MKIYKYIATSLGMGYSPFAPGTAGSILGIILLFFLNKLFISLNIDKSLILILDLVVIILVVLIGVKAIKKVHQIWEHDASKIVIDEVVGVWITALLLPIEWQYYAYALIVFRFFDILKPFYIKTLDKMHSDWSVMLDDILAGVYSFISMQVLLYFDII